MFSPLSFYNFYDNNLSLGKESRGVNHSVKMLLEGKIS